MEKLQMRTDTWMYRVCQWYMNKRGLKELPKSRCHYCEIVFFYALAYLGLGLLFKVILGLLGFIWVILKPLRIPAGWFVKKAEKDVGVHRSRFPRAFIFMVVVCALVLFADIVMVEIWDIEKGVPSLTFLLPQVFGAIVVPFVGFYLVNWYVSPILKPVLDFGQEAAQRISIQPSRPSPRGIGRVISSSIRGTVTGIRQSRETAKTLRGVIGDFYRRVCPLIEFVEPNNKQVSSG